MIEQGQLVEMLSDHTAKPMPLSFLYANRRHLPQLAQTFMR